MQHSPLSAVLFAVFCVAAAAGFAYCQRRWQRETLLPDSDGESKCSPDNCGSLPRDDHGAAPAQTETSCLRRGVMMVLAQTSFVFIAPWTVLPSAELDRALRNQASAGIGLFVTMLVVGIVYSRRRDWS